MKGNETCHVTTTSFRNELDSKQFPYEPNRYWLYTSKLCPFAHRTEIVRAFTGLQDEIGLTIAGPVQTEEGWNLVDHYESDDSDASPVPGVDRLPGIYELSSPGYEGRASVPVLFDTQTQRIVNNESAEIIRQLDKIAVSRGSDSLYPQDKRELIDRITTELHVSFIRAIYQAGFAKSQHDHYWSGGWVLSSLERLDKQLGEVRPYLTGEHITLADVHAYPHLARFDAIYYSLYRLNQRFVSSFPNVSRYLERLGEHPAFSGTLDVDVAKAGYFLSWNQPTNGHFVPVGPAIDPRTGLAQVS